MAAMLTYNGGHVLALAVTWVGSDALDAQCRGVDGKLFFCRLAFTTASSGHALEAWIECGSFIVTEDPGDVFPDGSTPPPWRWSSSVPDRANSEKAYRAAPYRFGGFAYNVVPMFGGEERYYVLIPLWFPTILSAALLWFVWRKTRKKGTSGAFPVEPAPAREQSANRNPSTDH